MHRVYEYRRHLPHYQSDNKAIFLTFSTHQRWIIPPDARTIVLESCAWGNGTRLNLHGAVVMPDHVHLIFTPLYNGDSLYSVAEIMQGIKSASAHKINHLLGRKSRVWQHESLDRVLRREESIRAKVEYMIQESGACGFSQNCNRVSLAVGSGSGKERGLNVGASAPLVWQRYRPMNPVPGGNF